MARIRPIDPNSNIIKLSTRNQRKNKLIVKVLIGLWALQTLITLGYILGN